jgi:ATP-dependent helicase/DNAse subunit B
MNTLKQTAQHIYHGDIDANPLITQKRNSCQYCGYQDICGNLQQQPCRSVTGSASEAKEQMLEILRQMEEEES